MKNKYGIGFFAAAIIAVLAVSSAYQLSYQKAKERAQTQVTKEQEEPATSKSEPTCPKICLFLCFQSKTKPFPGAKRRLILSDGSQRLRGRISER